MAELPSNPAIPESITLDGKVYNVKSTPELQELVVNAQRVEKNKLYSTIDKVKKDVEALRNAEIIDNPAVKSALNVDELVSKLDQVLESKLSTVRSELADLRQRTLRIDAETVEQYREKVIKENEGRCIPELVKGNTKEDIDRTLQESIALRQKYSASDTIKIAEQQRSVKDPLLEKEAERLKNQPIAATPTTPTQQSTPAPNLQSITIPVKETPAAGNTPNIAGMTHEEFARRREELQSVIASLVP